MKRRRFICLLGGFAVGAPPLARAQSGPAVGFLSPAAPSVAFYQGFPAGLREQGYVDGQNVRIEARWAHGRLNELTQLAKELVGLNASVLVASLTQAALAAQSATSTIPIVMAGVADPVAVGLIASLARPGGNITGTSSSSADIVGKQFELLTEALPGLSRVAVLWNPDNAAFQRLQLARAELAAREAGLRVKLAEARRESDFAGAFADIAKAQSEALAVLGDPLFSFHARSIAELALKHRLPTVSAGRTYSEAGVLLTYGPDFSELHRRAAVYVVRILKGALPAELPVELPTKFETVINLKTAKALGLVIPSTLLSLADGVIE